MNDYDKDYLVHHGILGQKWGQQNGPPYPLDKSQKTVAELKNVARTAVNVVKNKKNQIQRDQNLKKARKAREEESERKKEVKDLTKKGSISEILKNIDKIKPEEYEAILSRVNFEKKLKDIESDRTEKNAQAVGKILETVGKVGKTSESVIQAYNAASVVWNTFKPEEAKAAKKIDLKSDKYADLAKAVKDLNDRIQD